MKPDRSAGSQELTRLYVKLLNQEIPSLAPSIRGKLHEAHLGLSPSDEALDAYFNRFAREFGIESIEEIGGLLGAKVTRRNAVSAVLGGKSCPVPLHFAFSAFALKLERNLESAASVVQDQAAGQRSAKTEEMPLNPLHIAELCRRASNFAIPAAAILEWTNGVHETALCVQFSFSPRLLRRFFNTLPPSLQVLLPLAEKTERTDYRHLVESTSEQVQAFHRAEIESAVLRGSEGRVGLLKLCKKSYLWAIANDEDWLNSIVPKLTSAKANSPERMEELRQMHRQKIREALQAGAVLRRDLLVKANTSYKWCLSNDAEWLDRQVPRGNRWRTTD